MIRHVVAGLLVLLAAAGLVAWFAAATRDLPARGYTPFGLATGIGATALLLVAALYSWRKRSGQEFLPWRLQTWLGWHVWLPLLAVVGVLVHAGFHLDGAWGTWAFVLLLATLGSGLAGGWFYLRLPGQVYADVGNLAVPDTERRLDDIDARMEDLAAGRSESFRARVAALRGAGGRAAVGHLPPEEQPLMVEAEELADERGRLRDRLARQRVLKRRLRAWLWLHVPAACLFLAAAGGHAYDATGAHWVWNDPGPTDWEDPETCAECHPAQYEEWAGSMHAIAMASPVTEIQNRLVLEAERPEVPVGDFCVKCHAPTGYFGDPDASEKVLATRSERAPASSFGVSCVACHQVGAIHPGSGDRDGIRFKNIENLRYDFGKTMFGHFGRSVGNRAHRGEYRAHFESAEFCASCHTVLVDVPGRNPERVKLQDTFREWEEGPWSDVRCMQCHNLDLDGIVEKIGRTPFDGLRALVDREIRANRLPAELAASPYSGFDRPLAPRRRVRHTFVGVDYHLEDDLPYPAGHPRAAENPRIQEDTVQRMQALMRVAAAVRIRAVDVGTETVTVDVMNLATGHNLPAGFAFAREMWLEVAVVDRGRATVLVGGREGRPLEPHESLKPEKDRGPVRNFQAVLFKENRPGTRPFFPGCGEETVLQNEATIVLSGKDANEAGFRDRVAPLKAGATLESLVLRAPGLRARARSGAQVRVRLRFRNYAVEFLERLAARDKKPAGATRTRALIGNLVITDMAQAAVTLR